MVTYEQAIENPKENFGKDVKMYNNDIVISKSGDLEIVKFEDNLSQAIKNRFQTILTELIVNPNYGSRLKLMLGSPKTEALKIELRNEIEFTMLQEPRIQRVDNIIITFDDYDVSRVNIMIDVLPIGMIHPMNMVFELFI